MEKKTAAILGLLALVTFAGVGWFRILTNPTHENLPYPTHENLPTENQIIKFFTGYENYLNRKLTYALVGSSSMEPTFAVNDTVVWVEVDPAELKERDIIIYEHPTLTGGPLWAHRIIEIRTQYGELRFRTKGDNLSEPDRHLVPQGNVRGLVIGLLQR